MEKKSPFSCLPLSVFFFLPPAKLASAKLAASRALVTTKVIIMANQQAVAGRENVPRLSICTPLAFDLFMHPAGLAATTPRLFTMRCLRRSLVHPAPRFPHSLACECTVKTANVSVIQEAPPHP